MTEEAKVIVEKIKEMTKTYAYELETTQEEASVFDSKFGGYPYWDKKKEYPTDENGEKMMLLAQINFGKEMMDDERLPKSGILQFFISASDDLYGADYDNPTNQTNFRIVYHENIDNSVTEEQIKEIGMPTNETAEYTPVNKEVKVRAVKKEVYMGPADAGFEKAFRKVIKDMGEEDCSSWDYFDEEDYEEIFETMSNDGHWILGYPYFTQNDPREYMEDKEYDSVNLLLFQMDSDNDFTLWGDCGVANFFTNEEDLKNKNFEKILYNWDCC